MAIIIPRMACVLENKKNKTANVLETAREAYQVHTECEKCTKGKKIRETKDRKSRIWSEPNKV